MPTIPDVTLLGEIARGGMGVVYRGRQDFLDRDVAVKLLSPHLQGEEFAARFRREAKILAGIRHPNIVACHMAGTTNTGQSYLVMELVDGPSLKSWIAEHGALPLPAALRIVRQLASALGQATDLGVIHRDVKPENILLEAPTSTSLDLAFPYVPKLVDLGLARMTHETGDLGLTAPGSVMGTPVTMAPEQFDAPDSVDFRADIYGLGCVLYQALTGVAAFESTQLTDIVIEKRRPEGPDPCERFAEIPTAVGRLVAMMLACDRAARPSSYKELITRLDELSAAVARGVPPANEKDAGPGSANRKKLLETAEIEFLAEDVAGGRGFRRAPVAFPDPTGVHPRTTAAPRARRRGRRLFLIGAVATALLFAAVVKRNRRDKASSHTSPTAPSAQGVDHLRPRSIAIRGLDGAIRPGVKIELSAETAHPDGDTDLRYRWSVRPTGNSSLTAAAAAATDLLLEGLPGDEFVVGLEVRDGSGEPLEVVRNVVLDHQPVDLFADFLARDTEWTSPGRGRGGKWTRANGGAVSCAAAALPGVRSRNIPGRVWRMAGQLRPERQQGRTFAQTAVCLRIGLTEVLALLCEREGPAGEYWSISLQEVDRDAGRAGFAFRPLPQRPKAVKIVDDDGKLTGASYSITRRGGELVFTLGFPDIGQVVEHRERVRSSADSSMVILFAKGGRGVFPKLELW